MSEPLGPVNSRVVPRYAGLGTFARLPRRDEVDRCDVGIIGVPFDGGATYRPGARFGPNGIREGSRLLRPRPRRRTVRTVARDRLRRRGRDPVQHRGSAGQRDGRGA